MIKGLSLTQPWASLVAFGEKRVETRSWNTKYRGWIAIHAAKGFPRTARDLVIDPRFYRSLTGAGISGPVPIDRLAADLPTSKIIALVRLIEVIPTDRIKLITIAGVKIAEPPHGIVRVQNAPPLLFVSEQEAGFGNYGENRFAWVFDEILPIEPIEARGVQRLFNLPPFLAGRLESVIVERFGVAR